VGKMPNITDGCRHSYTKESKYIRQTQILFDVKLTGKCFAF